MIKDLVLVLFIFCLITTGCSSNKNFTTPLDPPEKKSEIYQPASGYLSAGYNNGRVIHCNSVTGDDASAYGTEEKPGGTHIQIRDSIKHINIVAKNNIFGPGRGPVFHDSTGVIDGLIFRHNTIIYFLQEYRYLSVAGREFFCDNYGIDFYYNSIENVGSRGIEVYNNIFGTMPEVHSNAISH